MWYEAAPSMVRHRYLHTHSLDAEPGPWVADGAARYGVPAREVPGDG
jgi:hypothetical protein